MHSLRITSGLGTSEKRQRGIRSSAFIPIGFVYVIDSSTKSPAGWRHFCPKADLQVPGDLTLKGTDTHYTLQIDLTYFSPAEVRFWITI